MKQRSRAVWYILGGLTALALAVLPALYIKSQCDVEKPHRFAPYHLVVQGEGMTSGSGAEEKQIAKGYTATVHKGGITEQARAESTYYPPEQSFDWWSKFLCEINIADYTLAYFTVVLAVSTIGLSWITWRAVALGREEFTASHRPRVAVRRMRLLRYIGPFNDSANPFQVEITAANRGDAPAQIIAIRATAFRRQKNNKRWHGELIFIEIPLIAALPYLDPGQSEDISLEGKKESRDVRSWAVIDPKRVLGRPDLDEVIIGEVRYKGADGVIRTTGFLRRFDVDSLSFIAEADPGYEYED